MSHNFRLERTAADAGRRQRNATVPSLLPSEGRVFGIAGAAYVPAAAAVAAVHATAPISHGWWLASYLALVGGLSQALLGSGLAAFAPSSVRETVVQLALWNIGVVTVAAADLAGTPAGVLAGSAVLLAALARFARSCLRAAGERFSIEAGLYLALVAFLAGSVVVGTALAGALPGR
jgi:hypothetical protein